MKKKWEKMEPIEIYSAPRIIVKLQKNKPNDVKAIDIYLYP